MRIDECVSAKIDNKLDFWVTSLHTSGPEPTVRKLSTAVSVPVGKHTHQVLAEGRWKVHGNCCSNFVRTLDVSM